jgi:transposase
VFRDKRPTQEMLFIPGRLSDYIPDDHILKRVHAVLDLRWLADEVRDLYSKSSGRPCIEPERAVRLMLAGFFHGIVHDRKLVREAQVNIAYRWFAGYELDEPIPDHSTLTRIRQRWGEEKFQRIFEKSVKQCIAAGMVAGEMCHIDASLVRADVSWKSLVARHVEKVFAENESGVKDEEPPEGDPPDEMGSPSAKKPGKVKKVSKTDPEASMATSSHDFRLEPTYKQNTAVDDQAGVIVDIHVTTGEANEGREMLDQIERVKEITGATPKTVTADAGYASGRNYEALEQAEITGVIPPQKERKPKGGVALRRFKYDPVHDVVRCPMGKKLVRGSRGSSAWFYRAKASDCKVCPLREKCVPQSTRSRSVLIVDGYCALLRARRKKEQGWPEEVWEAYRRHRWQVEGVHGEAKTQHGMRRAVRRGLSNMRIQCYLTAAVINLKRLAMAASDGSLLRAIRHMLGLKASIPGHIGRFHWPTPFTAVIWAKA